MKYTFSDIINIIWQFSRFIISLLPLAIILILGKWGLLILYVIVGLILFLIFRYKLILNSKNWMHDLSAMMIIWPTALTLWNELYIDKNKVKNSKQAYTYNEDYFYYLDLGNKALNAMKYKTAEKYYKQAKSLNKYDALYYDFISRLYLGLEKNDFAIRNLLTYAHIRYADDYLIGKKNNQDAIDNLKQLELVAPWVITHYELDYKKLEEHSTNKRLENILSNDHLLFNLGFSFVISCKQLLYEQVITESKIKDIENFYLNKESRRTLTKGAVSRIIKYVGVIGLLENLDFALFDKEIIINYYFKNYKRVVSPLTKFSTNNKFNPEKKDESRHMALAIDGAMQLEENNDCLGAIELLNESLKLNNSFGAAYLYRGKAYLRLGKTKEALEDFRDVIKYDPRLESEIPTI
jgi:tetratricopeptide (TPR) repeat protein